MRGKFDNYFAVVSAMSFVFVAFISLLSSCDNSGQVLEDRNYQLVWSDDFDAAKGEGLDLGLSVER